MSNLLLVDDDAISRDVLTLVLSAHGFQVTAMESGESALEAVAPELEAVLLDAQMPGLSGLDLIRALRERTSAAILLMSGSPVAQDLEQAADGFLRKPFTPAELQSALAGIKTAHELARFASNSGVIDQETQEVLAKLRSVMPEERVRLLLQTAHDDLEKQLAALGTAVESGDREAVCRISHRIKGGAGMVGLKAIAAVAARLEADEVDGHEGAAELSTLFAVFSQALPHM